MEIDIDLDKLEQVARAATPGEQWRMVEQSPATTGLRVDSGYQCFFNTSRPNDFCNKEVRANIAFIDSVKPDVVLELVRRLRAAESKEAASHDMMIALAGLLETMQKAPPVDLVRRLSESHKECLAAYTKAYNAIAAQGASHD